MSKSEITNIYGGVIPCFKSNYPEFVKAFGYKVADECMEKTFGNLWLLHRETIWQWYDIEFNNVPRRTQGGA
jgi:hypothetical protein